MMASCAPRARAPHSRARGAPRASGAARPRGRGSGARGGGSAFRPQASARCSRRAQAHRSALQAQASARACVTTNASRQLCKLLLCIRKRPTAGRGCEQPAEDASGPRLLIDVLEEELGHERVRALVRQQPVVQQVALEPRQEVLGLLQAQLQRVQGRLRAPAAPRARSAL